MQSDKELMQMALDALEFETDYDTAITLQKAAIEMLRAALAQPERDEAPAKAVEWQGLTDKEILADDVLRYHFALNGGAGPISKNGMAVIAAVNAKLKEKNA